MLAVLCAAGRSSLTALARDARFGSAMIQGAIGTTMDSGFVFPPLSTSDLWHSVLCTLIPRPLFYDGQGKVGVKGVAASEKEKGFMPIR